jgi:Glycosyltransferase family 92
MAKLFNFAHALSVFFRYLMDRPTRRSLSYRIPLFRATSCENRRHYLCTVTIVRNEAKYIAEFVAFHKVVGVDHMLIYDDNSTDDLRGALAPFLQEGFVEVTSWPRLLKSKNHQFAAYQQAVARMTGKTTWLAMIDADEFLFAPSSGNLKAELQARESFSAIGVYSRTFGTGDVEAIPKGGLVVEWLNMRGKIDHIKNTTQRTIARPECVSAIRSANTCGRTGSANSKDWRNQPH